MRMGGSGTSDGDAIDRTESRQLVAIPGRPGAPAIPFEVRARVTITPWTDLAFARTVREVMRTVSLSEEIVLGSGNGAVLAERLLRERGYARARVLDARSTDEALRRVAHWQVLRDGEATAPHG
jgi:hypothetical protein